LDGETEGPSVKLADKNLSWFQPNRDVIRMKEFPNCSNVGILNADGFLFVRVLSQALH
jgi:hypothetical protein